MSSALLSATVGDAAAAAIVTGPTSGGEASVIDVFAAVMLYELKTNSRNKRPVWSRSRKIGVRNQFWSDLSAVKREICSTRCYDQVDIIILVVDPLLNE